MRRVAVIGLGTLGKHVAISLTQFGLEVIAVDKSESIIDEIQDQVTSVMILDTTKEKNIPQLNIQHLDAILITIGERFVEESILTTFLLSKKNGPDLYVRTVNETHQSIIEKIGVKKTFNPERSFAERLAQGLARPSILEMYSVSEDGYVITDLVAQPEWVGKTLLQLDLRAKHGFTVLSTKRKTLLITSSGEEQTNEKVVHNPKANFLIQKNDVLVCFGELKEFEKIVDEKE